MPMILKGLLFSAFIGLVLGLVIEYLLDVPWWMLILVPFFLGMFFRRIVDRADRLHGRED